jgi:ubiquinone/menaquinone biosynthesis C-methylase UbiE
MVPAKIDEVLSLLTLANDGIYGVLKPSEDQAVEFMNRTQRADKNYDNYLEAVPLNHSVPVMDFEVKKFIDKIPMNGVVLDLGGCWGWHWRSIGETRPDICVVIVDFVRHNLTHAQNILGNTINKNIFLVNGDATSLNFNSKVFDGVWTVQCFQHIPDFNLAVSEAARCLKIGGSFANYSLNIQPQVKFVKSFTKSPYVVSGLIAKTFWLARASNEQKSIIEKAFNCVVTEYWSEFLFCPALKFNYPGREMSFLGKIDSRLTNKFGLLKWFARQHSYHVKKL